MVITVVVLGVVQHMSYLVLTAHRNIWNNFNVKQCLVKLWFQHNTVAWNKNITCPQSDEHYSHRSRLNKQLQFFKQSPRTSKERRAYTEPEFLRQKLLTVWYWRFWCFNTLIPLNKKRVLSSSTLPISRLRRGPRKWIAALYFIWAISAHSFSRIELI